MKKNLLMTVAFRLSLTICSLLIVLILFEVLLRQSTTHVRSSQLKGGFSLETTPEKLIRYTSKGRRLVPNADVVVHNHYLSGRDVPLTTNQFGFRHPPMEEQAADDEQRILVLGDSITIAEYLPREDTFVYQAEQHIQAKFPDTHITVINAGVMDIGLRESIDILEEQGTRVNPSMVVLSYYLNDPRPSWGFSKEIRHRGWLRRHSVLAETIYHQVKLQQWIQETGADRFAWITKKDELDWQHKKADFDSLIQSARFDWGAGWVDEDWQLVNEQLTRLKTLSKKHHFSVMVVFFPVHFQVSSEVLDTKPQDRMAALTRKFEFDYLDLLPHLREYHQEHPEEEIFYDQCHPTEKSSAFIGSIIAKKILEERTIEHFTLE